MTATPWLTRRLWWAIFAGLLQTLSRLSVKYSKNLYSPLNRTCRLFCPANPTCTLAHLKRKSRWWVKRISTRPFWSDVNFVQLSTVCPRWNIDPRSSWWLTEGGLQFKTGPVRPGWSILLCVYLRRASWRLYYVADILTTLERRWQFGRHQRPHQLDGV